MNDKWWLRSENTLSLIGSKLVFKLTKDKSIEGTISEVKEGALGTAVKVDWIDGVDPSWVSLSSKYVLDVITG